MSDPLAPSADAEELSVSGQFLTGDTSFLPDPYFYRTLLPGQDFLDADKFVTYAEMVQRIRSNGKRVILTLGDSFTSGWDTRIAPVNRERRKKGLPMYTSFFRYKTYSDMLRDRIGDEFEIVNAGVPGYTSLLTLRRFRDVQSRFLADGIRIDYVMCHVGNNDCVWEGNFVDRYHLHRHPRSWPIVEKIRRRLYPRPSDRMHLRTTAEYYAHCLRELARQARRGGSRPILMLPQSPIYWEPGRRYAPYNFEYLATLPGAAYMLKELEEAKRLWASVIDKPYSAEKVATLLEAVERDHILPRIKQRHAQELQRMATEENVPLVYADAPRDRDDIEFFIDYGHAHENVNAKLADELLKHL